MKFDFHGFYHAVTLVDRVPSRDSSILDTVSSGTQTRSNSHEASKFTSESE